LDRKRRDAVEGRVMFGSVSMKSARVWMMLGAAAMATACVPQREAPPPPEQPQPTRIPPPAPPAPPPPPADWRDIPLTGGAWYYRNEGAVSQALFGPPQSEASLIVRCDRARRQVTLSRAGIATGNMMTVRTSSGARNFPLSVQAEPLPYVSAALSSNDRFLDGMAFSRGRFTIEVPGTTMLVLPAWPEPARVIEDCRF
jgi:hypothetical protein